jgi:hypothetical protein
MTEFLNYLNSPHLVANFQKIFGIESKFDDSNHIQMNHHFKYVGLPSHSNTKSILVKPVNEKYTNSSSKNINVIQTRSRSNNLNANSTSSSTTTLTINKNSHKATNSQSTQTNEFKINTENDELKRTKKLVNITDDKNIIANTTIHIKFWYYFFRLGAAMGNEIFYCLFFPFWFWNVDGAIARKVGFLWGIYMTVGQATKDLLCMPRPASPPVVKLEDRYLAEFGFPSTHAMVIVLENFYMHRG